MKDDVLRKVGRNVVLFQQIESMLKLLVSLHHNQGTIDTFAEQQQKRSEKVHTQTMGQLAEMYKNGILSGTEILRKEPENLKAIHVSVTFQLEGDPDLLESHRSNLEILVNERNALIHHFLPKWIPDSQEAMADAMLYLDQQREKVMPMFDHLKASLESLQSMAAFCNSEEYGQLFDLAWLQGSPLISLLIEEAANLARSDGWVNLADAGRIAREREFDAVQHMKERYGHSQLKHLLIASELFEVKDETLPKGGFHTLYRVKPI